MDNRAAQASWTAANQAFLAGEFLRLKQLLGAKDASEPREEKLPAPMESPSAIDWLTDLFGLSPFERDLLLLCAGVEMDSQLAALCAAAQGRSQNPNVTFGLALAALPEPHWSALTPSRPLRRFLLVNMAAGPGLTSAPLRIDERILHFLAGINILDPRLQALIDVGQDPEWIAETHKKTALDAARVFEIQAKHTPVLQICGDDLHGQEDVAEFVARQIGRQLLVLPVERLAATGQELDQLAILLEREMLLLPGVLLIQGGAIGL